MIALAPSISTLAKRENPSLMKAPLKACVSLCGTVAIQAARPASTAAVRTVSIGAVRSLPVKTANISAAIA